MSDTPETDAALQKCWDANGEPYADHELESMVDVARRLERERDALREENRKLWEALGLCLSRIETHTQIILTNADMIAMESARNALK